MIPELGLFALIHALLLAAAFVIRALALNPAFPAALEMAGGAAFEAQEYAKAALYWRDLLAQLPAQARARIELEAAIARADGLASR